MKEKLEEVLSIRVSATTYQKYHALKERNKDLRDVVRWKFHDLLLQIENELNEREGKKVNVYEIENHKSS